MVRQQAVVIVQVAGVAALEIVADSAMQLAPLVRRRSRVCPLALAALYRAILDEVERAGYDVYSTRISLGPARKLGLLGLSFGRGLVIRNGGRNGHA